MYPYLYRGLAALLFATVFSFTTLSATAFENKKSTTPPQKPATVVRPKLTPTPHSPSHQTPLTQVRTNSTGGASNGNKPIASVGQTIGGASSGNNSGSSNLNNARGIFGGASTPGANGGNTNGNGNKGSTSGGSKDRTGAVKVFKGDSTNNGQTGSKTHPLPQPQPKTSTRHKPVSQP